MIVEIRNPKEHEINSLKILWEASLSVNPNVINAFFETVYSSDNCLCARLESGIVSALYILECSVYGKRAAYLYAVATSDLYRNKGISAILISEAEEYLKNRGCEIIFLVPRKSELFSFYEKLGYRSFGGVTVVDCKKGGEEVDIRRVQPCEYLSERNRLLPKGAVIQEGKSIELLSKISELYAGDDFAISLVREKDKIYGNEFLGDTRLLPGILLSLGVDTGVFRTVGDSLPFAMYKTIGDEKLPEPLYFGLSLY